MLTYMRVWAMFITFFSTCVRPGTATYCSIWILSGAHPKSFWAFELGFITLFESRNLRKNNNYRIDKHSSYPWYIDLWRQLNFMRRHARNANDSFALRFQYFFVRRQAALGDNHAWNFATRWCQYLRSNCKCAFEQCFSILFWDDLYEVCGAHWFQH